jgi:3-hydroxybutyrate dehydrogenase
MADHPDEKFQQAGPGLSGHVALVTGASRGIGRAIAVKLASLGASVAICARDSAALGEALSAVAASGTPCLAQAADVTQEQSVEALVSRVTRELGGIDILVNNAGMYRTQPVQGHSLALWNEILSVNLTGAMLAARAVLPGMLAGGWGRIVNIASISGKVAEIYGSAYSASKFGLIGLSQALALEVAAGGITVNAVCPGWVATEMARQQLEDPLWCKLNSIAKEESTDVARWSVPLQRFIEPAEVANLVAYLCSCQAGGITGQSVNICGGLSLH